MRHERGLPDTVHGGQEEPVVSQAAVELRGVHFQITDHHLNTTCTKQLLNTNYTAFMSFYVSIYVFMFDCNSLLRDQFPVSSKADKDVDVCKNPLF